VMQSGTNFVFIYVGCGVHLMLARRPGRVT
jgi:hypothetical protein